MLNMPFLIRDDLLVLPCVSIISNFFFFLFLILSLFVGLLWLSP